MTISSQLTGDEIKVLDHCTFERLRNHWLVDLVPDSGMSRVFDCLKEVLEDFVDRPAYKGPFTQHLTSVTMGAGKSYERPALEFVEE